jgi:hypothetical protein
MLGLPPIWKRNKTEIIRATKASVMKVKESNFFMCLFLWLKNTGLRVARSLVGL